MCLNYHRIRYILFLLASPIMYWPPLLSLYIKSVWKAQKYSRGIPIPQGLAGIVRKKYCQKLVCLHSYPGFSLYFHAFTYLFSLITKETKGWIRIGFLWKIRSQRFYQISREVFIHTGNFQCNLKGLPEVLKFSTVCHKMDILFLVMLNIWVSLKCSIQVLYSLSLYMYFGELSFHGSLFSVQKLPHLN